MSLEDKFYHHSIHHRALFKGLSSYQSSPPPPITRFGKSRLEDTIHSRQKTYNQRKAFRRLRIVIFHSLDVISERRQRRRGLWFVTSIIFAAKRRPSYHQGMVPTLASSFLKLFCESEVANFGCWISKRAKQDVLMYRSCHFHRWQVSNRRQRKISCGNILSTA